jgi:hypothetical protein
VFFWLPKWVADSNESGEQAVAAAGTVEPATSDPAKPHLSPEEAAALQARAETLLANLLTQQNRLNAQSVASWGGEQWQRYEGVAATGDDALLADDFAAAVASYTEATALGNELLKRAGQTVESALTAAAAAFARVTRSSPSRSTTWCSASIPATPLRRLGVRARSVYRKYLRSCSVPTLNAREATCRWRSVAIGRRLP